MYANILLDQPVKANQHSIRLVCEEEPISDQAGVTGLAIARNTA